MIILVLVGFGLVFGSFINALVWRLRQQELASKKLKAKSLDQAKDKYSILHGRSMCVDCGHQLVPKDLVPVVSWVLLKGRCRYCHKPISWQYPVVELLTATLFVLLFVSWPLQLNAIHHQLSFIFWLLMVVGLVALTVYDLRWMLLPNKLIYPMTALAVLHTLLLAFIFEQGMSTVVNACYGLLVGGGLFYILFQISNGRWIGGGDVKLGFLLGLLVGGAVQAVLLIFAASLLGTLFALPMLLTKKVTRTMRIPFGPFLIMAAIIVKLFGDSLIIWYTSSIFGI